MGEEDNKPPKIPQRDLVMVDDARIVPYFVWDDDVDGKNAPVDQALLWLEKPALNELFIGKSGASKKRVMMIDLQSPSRVYTRSTTRIGYIQRGLPYELRSKQHTTFTGWDKEPPTIIAVDGSTVEQTVVLHMAHDQLKMGHVYAFMPDMLEHNSGGWVYDMKRSASPYRWSKLLLVRPGELMRVAGYDTDLLRQRATENVAKVEVNEFLRKHENLLKSDEGVVYTPQASVVVRSHPLQSLQTYRIPCKGIFWLKRLLPLVDGMEEALHRYAQSRENDIMDLGAISHVDALLTAINSPAVEVIGGQDSFTVHEIHQNLDALRDRIVATLQSRWSKEYAKDYDALAVRALKFLRHKPLQDAMIPLFGLSGLQVIVKMTNNSVAGYAAPIGAIVGRALWRLLKSDGWQSAYNELIVPAIERAAKTTEATFKEQTIFEDWIKQQPGDACNLILAYHQRWCQERAKGQLEEAVIERCKLTVQACLRLLSHGRDPSYLLAQLDALRLEVGRLLALMGIDESADGLDLLLGYMAGGHDLDALLSTLGGWTTRALKDTASGVKNLTSSAKLLGKLASRLPPGALAHLQTSINEGKIRAAIDNLHELMAKLRTAIAGYVKETRVARWFAGTKAGRWAGDKAPKVREAYAKLPQGSVINALIHMVIVAGHGFTISAAMPDALDAKKRSTGTVLLLYAEAVFTIQALLAIIPKTQPWAQACCDAALQQARFTLRALRTGITMGAVTLESGRVVEVFAEIGVVGSKRTLGLFFSACLAVGNGVFVILSVRDMFHELHEGRTGQALVSGASALIFLALCFITNPLTAGLLLLLVVGLAVFKLLYDWEPTTIDHLRAPLLELKKSRPALADDIDALVALIEQISWPDAPKSLLAAQDPDKKAQLKQLGDDLAIVSWMVATTPLRSDAQSRFDPFRHAEHAAGCWYMTSGGPRFARGYLVLRTTVFFHPKLSEALEAVSINGHKVERDKLLFNFNRLAIPLQEIPSLIEGEHTKILRRRWYAAAKIDRVAFHLASGEVLAAKGWYHDHYVQLGLLTWKAASWKERTLEIDAPELPKGAELWVRFFDLAEKSLTFKSQTIEFDPAVLNPPGWPSELHAWLDKLNNPQPPTFQYPQVQRVASTFWANYAASALKPRSGGAMYVKAVVDDSGKAHVKLPPLQGPWEWDRTWEVFPHIYPFKELAADTEQPIEPRFLREIGTISVSIQPDGAHRLAYSE